jgi:ADP-heptose:LPS heptosyltransferase
VAVGLTLTELAAVLEKCRGFVGNDSGITHLAAAVGAPVVALFGPASSLIWEPRGKKVRIVRFGGQDVAEVRQTLAELLAKR